MLHDVTWSCDQNVITLSGDPFLRVTTLSLGSRGHGECGDMLLFICQVTSHNHVIKGSCNFLCSNLLSEVPILSHLVAIGLLEVDTCCLFICYVTSCDKMIKDSFEFLCCNPLSQATTLSSFFCHLTTFYHVIKRSHEFIGG